MREDDPRYCGERPGQGELTPMEIRPEEGWALLQCGGTSVRLSYSALHLMAGWLAVGCHHYGYPGISAPLCSAFNAVTSDAAIGRVAPAVQTWRPMATAPKDGTRILVCRNEIIEPVTLAYWSMGACDFVTPTIARTMHLPLLAWMPLPELPANPTARTGKTS